MKASPSPLLLLLPLLAAGFLASCGDQQAPPPIIDISSTEPITLEDSTLTAAATGARQSFPKFLESAGDLDSAGTAFMAKIRVTESEGLEEDLWVSSITAELGVDGESAGSGFYTGVVGDLPSLLQTLNLGDIVRFHLTQVIEWQYFERNQVKGAQVSRILRSRMSPAERAEFDASYDPFTFEEG